MTASRIIWLIGTLLFGFTTYAAFQGTGIPKAKKETLNVRDGSKRPGGKFRSSYPGGAYRFGK